MLPDENFQPPPDPKPESDGGPVPSNRRPTPRDLLRLLGLKRRVKRRKPQNRQGGRSTGR